MDQAYVYEVNAALLIHNIRMCLLSVLLHGNIIYLVIMDFKLK